MMLKLRAPLKSKILLCAFLVSAGALIVCSQEISQTPGVAMMVDLILLQVSVCDKDGNFIKDLKYKDFIILEDKREQSIDFFTVGTEMPLTIGLIVDTTHSGINKIDKEKTASRTFLNAMIQSSKDKAFLIQFGDKVELLQDLTSSPEKLAAAIDRLEPHPMASRMSMPDKKPSPNHRFAVADKADLSPLLSDSLLLALEKISSQMGKKALIVLGDGNHLGERREMAVTAAVKAATPIYPIRILTNEFADNSKAGESAMEKDLKMLAQKTGGTHFEIDKRVSLEQIYGKIEEELQNQYILGYSPAFNQNPKEGLRAITVKVKKEGLIARTLEGYYFHHESAPSSNSPHIPVLNPMLPLKNRGNWDLLQILYTCRSF
jgi:VWFA-related protein